MAVLFLAEQEQGQIKPASLQALSAANQCSKDIDVVVVGHQVKSIAELWQAQGGIRKIILADHPCYQHGLAESLAPLMATLGRDYQYVISAATTFSKNIMPRVAALLDVAQISEITRVVDQNTFERPIYAGNALSTVQSNDSIKVLTVRATAFNKPSGQPSQAPIEICDLIFNAERIRYIKQELTPTERPELTAARVVVSGGRGLGSAENFKILEELADLLQAAIGASRAAVDAGFVPNDYQVGQTGKMVAPELYIAIGISGAIQHLAGIKDSKVIVAINKDPDAPIFSIATYGLVGDLFEIVPALIQEIKKLTVS